MKTGGYLEKILRVDLSNGETAVESLDRSLIEKWIGGEGIMRELKNDLTCDGAEFMRNLLT